MNESNTEKFNLSMLRQNEIDSLKYSASILAIKQLENQFHVSTNNYKRDIFYSSLRLILDLHPITESPPEYGIFFKGESSLINDTVLKNLVNESVEFKPKAVSLENSDTSQSIYQTHSNDTFAGNFGESDEFLKFVEHKCRTDLDRSYITSFLYYDKKGQCSLPHVDNMFTSITALIMLDHHTIENSELSSSSVFYWPGKDKNEIKLRPGELIIFSGISVLHGRTPVLEDERVTCLLFSFKPKKMA
jgi:hypothetical protein